MSPVPPIDTSKANLAYISALKPGELVVEMGMSAMYGKRGVIYLATDGPHEGDVCVMWKLHKGDMGTSVTWGTRRVSDVEVLP